MEREGTTSENLPETHAVLKMIRAEVERRNPDCVLLAEANQWPEDTLPYFGQGDECHMAFHFPLMPRLFMALAQEDSTPSSTSSNPRCACPNAANGPSSCATMTS